MEMRKRGFEIVKGYDEKEINIPRRKTKYSAGYDFEAAKDVTILTGYGKPTLVPTGIKAYMEDDEVLKIYNRSSNPSKKHIILANAVGIIDKDHYGNENNDGEIFFAFFNIGNEEITIRKGDAIGQGIFQKYLCVDNEEEILNERNGGFGSTGK